VLAVNLYGDGAQSAPVSIIAAVVPDTPAAPTLTQDGTKVTFDWTGTVADNGGTALTGYIIQI